MSYSSQEAVPYLCTVFSELGEPVSRNRRTVFPEFALKLQGFLCVRETGLEFDQIIHPRSILPHDVER